MPLMLALLAVLGFAVLRAAGERLERLGGPTDPPR